MADVAVDRLVVLIDAQTRSFEAQLKKLEGQINGSTKRMSGSFNTLNRSIMGAGRSLAAAFGVGVGVALLSTLPRALAQSVTQLGDLTDAAQKAGISIKQLQQVTFAGIGTGTGQDQIVNAFAKLNLQLGEAASKGNDLGKILAANNVSLSEMQGDPVRALTVIADLMKNARTEQDKAVIGNAAFGRGFRELLPFLNQGGASIKELLKAAEETGYVINTQLVVGADDFGDKWAARIATWGKIFKGAIAEIVLELDQLIGKATGPLIAFDKWLRENTGKGLFMTPLDKLLATPPGGAPATGDDSTVVPEATKAVKEYKSALEDAKEAQKSFAEEQEKIADATQGVTDSLKGFIDSVVDDFRSAGAALESMFKNLTKQLIDAMLFGGGPFAGMMGTQGANGMPGGAIGGLVGKLFSSFGGGSGTGGSFGFKGSNAVGAAGMFGELFGPTAPVEKVTGGPLQVGAGLSSKQFPGGVASKAVGGLLDLISRGESLGNYNETLGSGRFTGGKVNLTGMNIGQVKSLMGAMLDQTSQLPKSSPFYNSSAMGKYQITRSTLNDFMPKVGLKDSDLFNPTNQDLLATAIAKSTGGSPAALRGRWPSLTAPDQTLVDLWTQMFGGMARGGPISGPKVVGEHGPELFVPRVPGTIVPNGGGGGMTVNIHNNAGVAVRAQRGGVNGQELMLMIEEKAAAVTNRINRGVFGLKPVASLRT